MNLSVIIVSYRVPELLRSCLESIEAGPELIVVDNDSGDTSAQMVQERFPDVTLIEMPTNMGFSVAVNEAARNSSGDALLLLNPDAELLPGGTAAMLDCLDREHDVAVVGFRQVDAQGEFQLAVGGSAGVVAELGRHVVQRCLDSGGRASRLFALGVDKALGHRMAVPWVSCSSLLVRRDAFNRIGGFDESYFLYFEDFDFCMRLREVGYRIVYDPSVTVVHRRGCSAAKSNGRAARAYRDSQLRFWRRHGGFVSGPAVAMYQKLRGFEVDDIGHQ